MGQRGYFLTRSKTSACPPALCNVSRSSETSYMKATGRTLMNPVRDLTVGLSADEPRQAIINWKAPVDASQVDYMVTLRKTFGNRRVGREQPGSAAVSATFNGLKAGHWYHVDVKAVGNGDVRSASRRCYFQQGTAGSQNTVGADEGSDNRTRNNCAAAQQERRRAAGLSIQQHRGAWKRAPRTHNAHCPLGQSAIRQDVQNHRANTE